NYTVTVTDAIGCSNSESFTVNALAESVLINLDTVAVGEVVQVDNILFKADSTEVLGSSLPVLNQIMDFIVSNPKVNIEIGGHTNTIPSHEYCDKLSTDRARNIAQFFYDKGVPTTRVTYKGYGKRQPITNDQSLEGRRKNQRVEIKILAK
ncbi:MAG TPA: OmpA family protein, partial [Saprospiraceae bacterium]|nr:OmpA family protein [Saprospiraceae bacterium]